MASIYPHPQSITCSTPQSSDCSVPRKMGDSIPDDVSSLGTFEQRKYASMGQNKIPGSTGIDFVVQAKDANEYDCKETTVLFNAIENKKWENVLIFLETGQIPGYSYCGLAGAMDPGVGSSLETRKEVQTWINRKNWWGETVSRSLPIHAAVELQAPIRVIHKLIERYPEGARSQDLHGNLPLHLAFKHGSSDSIIIFLLKAFPEAVAVENKGGRQPKDYASADTAAIIQVCMDQTKKLATIEEEKLSSALESEKARLAEILGQLKEIRSETDLLRQPKKINTTAGTTEEEEEEELGYKNDFATGVMKDRSPGSSNPAKTKKLPWTRKGKKIAPSTSRKVQK